MKKDQTICTLPEGYDVPSNKKELFSILSDVSGDTLWTKRNKDLIKLFSNTN